MGRSTPAGSYYEVPGTGIQLEITAAARRSTSGRVRHSREFALKALLYITQILTRVGLRTGE